MLPFTELQVALAQSNVPKFGKKLWPEDEWNEFHDAFGNVAGDINTYTDGDQIPRATLYPVENGTTNTEVYKELEVELEEPIKSEYRLREGFNEFEGIVIEHPEYEMGKTIEMNREQLKYRSIRLIYHATNELFNFNDCTKIFVFERPDEFAPIILAVCSADFDVEES